MAPDEIEARLMFARALRELDRVSKYLSAASNGVWRVGNGLNQARELSPVPLVGMTALQASTAANAVNKAAQRVSETRDEIEFARRDLARGRE